MRQRGPGPKGPGCDFHLGPVEARAGDPQPLHRFTRARVQLDPPPRGDHIRRITVQMQDAGTLKTGQNPGAWPRFGTVDHLGCPTDVTCGPKQPVLQADKLLQPCILCHARRIEPEPCQIPVPDKAGFQLVQRAKVMRPDLGRLKRGLPKGADRHRCPTGADQP